MHDSNLKIFVMLGGLVVVGSAGLPIVRFGVQIEISAPPAPLTNSAMMSTLTAHCQWEDETVS